MDVTNLMIGDFVYGIPYDGSPKYITTVDINVLMNITGVSFYKEDYEPILITDELLNAYFPFSQLFRFDCGRIWEMDNEGLVWITKDYDDKYRLVVTDNTEDLPLRINATVKYLHNVQHLLKEVGKSDLLNKVKI